LASLDPEDRRIFRMWAWRVTCFYVSLSVGLAVAMLLAGHLERFSVVGKHHGSQPFSVIASPRETRSVFLGRSNPPLTGRKPLDRFAALAMPW
jgi:hypothetical protein